MADSDEPAERNETECNCLEQALAALLEDGWSLIEGFGQLRQVTCRSCQTVFLTNNQSAELCPRCQEQQSASQPDGEHQLGE